jgi:hypothetical protein
MRPGKCVDRIERMGAVEREYRVAVMAGDTLDQALGQDPALLTKSGLGKVDFDSLQTKLEDTFFIRLFAEFETGVKDYWKNGLNRNPETRIFDVIASLASKHKIPDANIIRVHMARKYRNKLVHEEDSEADSMGLSEARKSLCRYFGYLAPDW